MNTTQIGLTTFNWSKLKYDLTFSHRLFPFFLLVSLCKAPIPSHSRSKGRSRDWHIRRSYSTIWIGGMASPLFRMQYWGVSEYHSSVTIFSWRPIFENADLSTNNSLRRGLWGTVRLLESLHPHANPRGNYAAPIDETNGFIFVRIRGGFHEIRNSICDTVVVARLLNATLARLYIFLKFLAFMSL